MASYRRLAVKESNCSAPILAPPSSLRQPKHSAIQVVPFAMDTGRYSLPIRAHFKEEWNNFFLLGIPPYSHNSQFNAEVHHYPPTWSPSTREINDGSGMLHLENLIIDNSPDFMCQTTFAPSTELGSPVVFDDGNLKFHLGRAGVNKTPDQSQGGVSMILPTNQTYQGTPVSTTSNFLVPSLLPEVADMSAVVKGPDQEQSRGKAQNLQKARKGSAVVSSMSSRQATGIRRAPTSKRYSCNLCGKRYAQSQGVGRHQRETHGASLCTYCDTFKWGRPYRYKAHLQKEHPDVAAKIQDSVT